MAQGGRPAFAVMSCAIASAPDKSPAYEHVCNILYVDVSCNMDKRTLRGQACSPALLLCQVHDWLVSPSKQPTS